MVAHGLAFNGKTSFLKDPWNVLDFFIVWISLLVLLASGIPALRPLKQLRILRVLRPLRLLARNEGMKLIITSLFKAMPAVGNVFGVICAFQLVFAILGTQTRHQAPTLPVPLTATSTPTPAPTPAPLRILTWPLP